MCEQTFAKENICIYTTRQKEDEVKKKIAAENEVK